MKNKIEYESKKLPENSEDKVISVLDKSILYKREKTALVKVKNKNVINKISIPKISIKKLEFNKLNIIFIVSILICFIMTIFLTNSIFAVQTEIKKVAKIPEIQIEKNNNQIDLMSVIDENISVVKRKELITEEAEINYMSVLRENPNLPKDEQILVQEGKNGRQELTKVRTYENEELVEELIIETVIFEDATQEVIDVGTSQFLKNLNVHVGDSVFATEQEVLVKEVDSNEIVAIIPQYYDVKLIELIDDYAKVEFQNNIGYVKTDNFSTDAVVAGISNKSRITKIKDNVHIEMDLTQKSGLTLNDYKKMLTNNSSDRNKIFEKNYDAFYNIEQKYNINGVFLASIAIHESGWGTSRIAMDKKNLFGFGSYDSSPYESSFTFNTYEEGLEVVARALIKNYLNPAGTAIYDNEVATGWYYNGPTVPGVNIRYASDQNWNIKVFSKMLYLYNKL